MSILRYHRTPLGARYRSPLGVFGPPAASGILIGSYNNSVSGWSTSDGSTLWTTTTTDMWGRADNVRVCAFNGGIAVIPRAVRSVSGTAQPVDVAVLNASTGAVVTTGTVSPTGTLATSTLIAHTAFGGEIYILFNPTSGSSEVVVLNTSLTEQRRFNIGSGLWPTIFDWSGWASAIYSQPVMMGHTDGTLFVGAVGDGIIAHYGYRGSDGANNNRYYYYQGSSASPSRPGRLMFYGELGALAQVNGVNMNKAVGWGGPGTTTLWNTSALNVTPAGFVRNGYYWHGGSFSGAYHVRKLNAATGGVEWGVKLTDIDSGLFGFNSGTMTQMLADNTHAYCQTLVSGSTRRVFKADLEFTSIVWNFTISADLISACLYRSGNGYQDPDYSVW